MSLARNHAKEVAGQLWYFGINRIINRNFFDGSVSGAAMPWRS
jgi:hypothetical protein